MICTPHQTLFWRLNREECDGRDKQHVGGGEERSIQGFVEKPEGKGPLGKLRCRWEDNIKMDLQEVGAWTGMSWLRI